MLSGPGEDAKDKDTLFSVSVMSRNCESTTVLPGRQKLGYQGRLRKPRAIRKGKSASFDE